MRLGRGLIVSVLWLAACAARGQDFQIGPDAPVDSLAVAAGNQEYLVAWRDITVGAAPRIFGATVTSLGLVSAEFPISNPESVPLESPVQHATLAFHPNAGAIPPGGTEPEGSFLAVWADTRAGGEGIRGANVSPRGFASADFLIAGFMGQPTLTDASGSIVAQPYAPQVIFTGLDWLVAWQDAPTGSLSGSQIRYARVPASGLPGPAFSLPGASAGGDAAQILEMLVPGPGGEALIVFRDSAASPVATRAARIAPDNSITGNVALLFTRDFGVTGFGLAVGAAFDPGSGEYLVISSHGAQIDSSVFKTRLLPGLPDGTVIRPSAPLAEVVQGTTGLAEDDFPRASFNGVDEFLFVRNDKASETAFHLLSQRVTLAGKNRDPNPVILDSAGQGVLDGAQAAAIGTQYLVVWMDGRRSGGQPARRLNVFGLLIDGSLPGDESPPFIRAVARAAPILGNSPLLVTFSGGGGGIIDSVRWDFGDGGSANQFAPTHTYDKKGEYIAVLSLNRSGYAARDFVRISVDSEVLGGSGGPPQSVGGSLGPVSDGVNTDIFAYNFTAVLNFAKPATDALRFFGYMDVNKLPVLVEGVAGALAIGGNTYSYKLRADGTFTSDFAKTVSPLFATSNRSRSANVATLTLAAAHNLAAGSRVGVDGLADATFNGTFVVTGVPSETTFTYANTGADAASAADAGGIVTAPAFTVSNRSRSADVATLTLTAEHNLAAGSTVRVAGLADATFNGTFVVTSAPSTTTFTYANEGADVASTRDTNGTPRVTFIINRTNGAFALNVSLENLQDGLAFGALNENSPKPGKELAMPFSFTFHNLRLDSMLHPLYIATAGKSGRAAYAFPQTGFQDSGFLRIFSALAVESGGEEEKPRVHAFTVLGQMGLGRNQALLKAAAGNWRITFGNYSEDIPVSALVEADGRYTYKAPKGATGISQFIYDSINEQWGVSFRNLRADGDDPSGMALAGNIAVRADMALSLDLDLANDGIPKYQASTYVRFVRPKADKKKWKLR